MTTRLLLLLTLSGALFFTRLQADTYTYPQLVQRLTDLQELAKLPPRGEKTSLASSYDRHSQVRCGDRQVYRLGRERETAAALFARKATRACSWMFRGRAAFGGPGRPRPVTGHVKIYLDGATTPAVDLPFIGYFDGKTAPFNRPNLVYIPSDAAHGFDNYTPIPFQKSCKIVGRQRLGFLLSIHLHPVSSGNGRATFSMNLSAGRFRRARPGR